MTATTNTMTLNSDVSALTALRALTAEPPTSIVDALHATERQAELFQRLLAEAPEKISLILPTLIPSIRVEYIEDIPVAGISFWAAHRWHIHVRASDPWNIQASTVLHELKHIIDHPMRQRYATEFSNSEWEALANHFAARVLAHAARVATRQGEEVRL